MHQIITDTLNRVYVFSQEIEKIYLKSNLKREHFKRSMGNMQLSACLLTNRIVLINDNFLLIWFINIGRIVVTKLICIGQVSLNWHGLSK